MNETLKSNLKYSAGGATVGAASSAWIGSSIGLAAVGTAFAGTLPVLIAGAVVGGIGTYACRDIIHRLKDGSPHDTDVDASG